jgi:hypothetical protein
LSQEIAQLLDELAGRMNTAQLRDPIGCVARLLERPRRGDFQPGIGRAVAKRRHKEQHQDRARFEVQTPPDTRIDATVRRLPECVRMAADLIRKKSLAEPSGGHAIAHLPSDPRPLHGNS